MLSEAVMKKKKQDQVFQDVPDLHMQSEGISEIPLTQRQPN